MLAKHNAESQSGLAPMCFSVTINCANFAAISGENLERRIRMAHDKRYVAQKRQRRRRKSVKAKMKLYEQGKLSHDKLPMLAKTFLRRKHRALKRAE
jgi:hypothetical protein